MMQYSFHAIGDLGSQKRCVDIDSESAYAVVSLNVSTTPVFIRQGICLPSYCTQGMYNDFGTKISNRLTTVLRKLIDKFNLDRIYILPSDTAIEISFVDTSTVYKKSEWDDAIQPQEPVDFSNDSGDTKEVIEVPGVYGP